MDYAHIVGGRITEIYSPPPGMNMPDLFHPNLVWVDITGRNPQPQPGWTATLQNGVWVMTPQIAPVMTMAQQALQALTGYVQIESVSTPLLNGNYSVSADTRVDLMAQMVSLAANNAFTNGVQSIDWPDVDLRLHSFDPAHFRSFATAIGSYVTALKQVVSGASNAMPTQPVQIM
jgi:hypothetical protein